MSQEKNLKNLVWILIIIILLVVSFIVYDKVLSVDRDDTPLEPVVDEDVIEELEEKVEEAKDEDEDEDDDEVKELEEKVEDLEEKVEDLEEEAKEEEKEEEVAAYEGENFITVISPNDGAGFCVQPVEFTGKVSPNTEKIVVTAFAEAGLWSGINDTYTLQDFEIGDTEFTYRANEDWDNLTYGGPKYTFKAYFDNGETQSTDVSIIFGTDDTSCGSHDGINITIDSPADGSTFITASQENPDKVTQLPIKFTGSVSINTTKIVVTATGGDINCDESSLDELNQPPFCIMYFKDIYTLKDFKHGDESFIYRVDFKWDNLTMDKNTYTFTAHFDDGSTQSEQVTIYIEIEQ